MNLVGYKNLEKTFRQLSENGKLSHSYIFFGDPQIGKCSFAKAFASFLETGKFDTPDAPLLEALVAEEDEKGVIGIDKVRSLKTFLSQKPVYSRYRTAIVDNAHKLTAHAQNALLKVTEEPPGSSLIILIVPFPEVLLDTLRSRSQKIYFPRHSEKTITKLIAEKFSLKEAEAQALAALSFGRPGRAISLAENEEEKEVRAEVLTLLKNRGNKGELIKELVEHGERLDSFFTNLVAELASDPIKNYDALRAAIERITNISRFNTNKRLQLEAALWTI